MVAQVKKDETSIRISDSFKKIILENIEGEDDKTIGIFNFISPVHKDGFLTKEQALKIAMWKSPRPKNNYEKNTDDDFVKVTKTAFEQVDEKIKIHTLTALIGVKIPTASAILMFYNPKKYPVIDIRAWQQLYKNGLVQENPEGNDFTLNNWITYLTTIRIIALELKLTPRKIEKSLYDFDKKIQVGNLYKGKNAKTI